MINSKIDYWDKTFIKNVFHKALPLIIGVIIVGFTNLIDNFMIGLFMKDASSELASSSLAQKYLKISIVFTQAAIALFGFLIYQYKGANQKDKVKEVIKLMIIFSIIIDTIVILIAFFAANPVMRFFQGTNYSESLSTSSGQAQKYMKILIFNIIPTSLFAIYLNVINAYGKQKILTWITIGSLFINALFNYIFYKGINLGLNGIAYSTILGSFASLIIILWWIFKKKIHKSIFFNPFLLFKINYHVLKIGLSKWMMGIQTVLWSFISIGITIIYSNWYGDEANERLAIVTPIVGMFYAALDGVASTKGYFVGREIGKSNKKQAYINDKKINMYTFIVASIEGILLISISYPIPLLWSVSSDTHIDTMYMLIAVGATYPIAAMSKCMLGSFKVAGMGKTIILSNGLFALCFEFMIPLILFLINDYSISIHINFWELYLISRCIKLVKLPPTLFFWKKQKWLEKSI